MMRTRAAVPILAFAALLGHSPGASADAPLPPGASVPVFSIAKSENKNQVQYAVRVDERCAPAGGEPIFAYWRMLERGPTQTEPLLSQEIPAYGLSSQSVASREAGGGQVHAVLKAMPSRPLTIVTSRGSDGKCRAVAVATIAGASANLFNVYVRLKWDGVDYLLLQGWSTDGSHVVREKLVR